METKAIPWPELFERYSAALKQEQRWLWVALGLLVVLGVPLALGRPRRVPRFVGPLLVVPIAAFAVWKAVGVAWVADDAFISFRYADNLAHGHGLVFNPGERVEGYTNFLWTVLASIPSLVDWSPVDFALLTSLGALAGALVLCTRLVALHAPAGRPVLVSFAALGLAGSYLFTNWGTSGLETMTAAFFVLLALERAAVSRPLAAGAAGTVAVLLHPDHAIFYAALGATYLLDRDRWSALRSYLLPFVLTVVPHLAFRFWYYGDLLPNTYYAKAADVPYYAQGRLFLAVNWFATGTLLALPFAALGIVNHLRTRLARSAWLSLPVYLLWVAKIGGDFMLGRLLVPVLPIVLVLAELAARRWASRGGLRLLPAAAALGGVLLAGVPARILKHHEVAWRIADESSYYRLVSLHPLVIKNNYYDRAELLSNAFVKKGLAPRFATGCVGIVGYATHLPILDTLGLNDRQIGRKPLGKRGRPGHEKGPTAGDVIPRGPDFSDLQHWPVQYASATELRTGSATYYLMAFRNQLAEPLIGDRSFSLTDARVLIDRYVALGPNLGVERAACDAWFWGTYYFAHNDDPSRRAAFLSRLARADPALAGVEELLLADPTEGDPHWRRVWSDSFDDASRWSAEGSAFRSFPTARPIAGQETVAPVTFPYASSYDPALYDEAEGRLVSKPFELSGDALVFRIAGGNDIARERASLVVDGNRVRSATGCGTEVLGRRVWNIAPWRGRQAVFEIVDGAKSGWGHAEVDDLAQWSRR